MATVKRFICRFFSTPDGCRFGDDECKGAHIPCCTNPTCVKLNKEFTHTPPECGRRGGAAYVPAPESAKPQPEAKAPKPKPQPQPKVTTAETINKFKQDLGENLFILVRDDLKAANMEGLYPANTLNPGKIVGMFLEACSLDDLVLLIEDPTFRGSKMVEALDVLKTN